MEINDELIEEAKELIQEYRDLVCTLWEERPQWDPGVADRLACIDNVLDELDDYL